MCSSDLFLGLIAVLFPPLPVWVKTGLCSVDSLINLALCCLGFLPGLIHSWYIIAKYPDISEYEALGQDPEGGRVTYVYVQHPGSQGGAPHPAHCHSHHGGARPSPRAQGYGTVKPMEAPVVGQNGNGTWEQGTRPETGANHEHHEHAAGGSAAPPPSYAQAVKGDHKVQSHE